MKAAVYRGPSTLVYEDVPDPIPGDDDLLVKVKVAGICGSDMHRFLGEMNYPIGSIMGHEYSGIVEYVGKNVKGFKIGDKVTSKPLGPCYTCELCRKGYMNMCSEPGSRLSTGSYAEYLKLNSALEIHKLAEHVSFEEGAFVEPLAIAIRSVKKAAPQIGDNVVVLGAGPIGILITAVLTTLPVNIIVSDISELRLNAVKKLGAHHIINAAKTDVKDELNSILGKKKYGRYHEGPDVDIVFEAAGAPGTFNQAMNLAKAEGRIVVTAYTNPPVQANPNMIPQKELNITGVFCYTTEFSEAVKLISEQRVNFKQLITHEYPLAQAQEGFKKQFSREESVKVILRP